MYSVYGGFSRKQSSKLSLKVEKYSDNFFVEFIWVIFILNSPSMLGENVEIQLASSSQKDWNDKEASMHFISPVKSMKPMNFVTCSHFWDDFNSLCNVFSTEF